MMIKDLLEDYMDLFHKIEEDRTVGQALKLLSNKTRTEKERFEI